jgi:hypothetical protein
MKKLITTGAVITMVLGTFSANAGDLTASAGLDLNTAYIFRGETVNDDVNLNPTMGVDLGSGLSVGTWANFNTDSSDFDEVDLTAGYALPMGENAPVGVSLGYTEYLYPNKSGVNAEGANTGATAADREVGIVAAYSGGTILQPSLGVYLGIDGDIDEQVYLELTSGYTVALSEDLSLDLGATLGYIADGGLANGETGLSHLTLSAGTGVETGFGTANIGVSYIVETDDKVLTVDEDLFLTVGIAL